MLKFYVCDVCGNLIMKIEDSGNVPFCCGKKMTELIPGSHDASKEKHVPVADYCEVSDKIIAICVRVGSDPHPSSEEHYIKWIALETRHGMYLSKLKPGDAPEACFHLDADDAVAHVYAYCNLHGLWIM